MVFFCCNACGSSLKKAQVEKHFCRSPGGRSFSCMDCHKDFRGDEYKQHTKCISEEEKYAGEGWKAPANRNKNEKKQMEWVETVQATMDNAGNTLDPSSRSLLQAMTKHENVPRKKPKFMNFVRNISKNKFSEQIIDKVWGLLESQWKLEKEKAAALIPSPQKSVVSNKQEADKDTTTTSETPELVEGKKKKKKDKKKQESISSDNQDNLEILTEVVSEKAENVDNEEEKKEKKKSKKKRKLDADLQNDQVSELAAEELNNTSVNDDDKKKKKKKSKKHRTLESESLEHDDTLNTLNGTHDDAIVASVQGSEDKEEKKKSKKKRKLESESLENDDTSNILNEDEDDKKEKKSKKKRKSKSFQESSTCLVTECV